MAEKKFYRVAVEGATATDGRRIERQMIVDAVATFNADTYGVRINCEHIRGLAPEGQFGAYGDVLALRSQEDEIELDGKKERRLALYAQVDPTDELVAYNRKRQKIYSSCEFQPKFAGTQKWGLVGLAVTDSPASLGTEAFKFSALKPMFDARKLSPDNLFSCAEEVEFDFEPATSTTSASEVTSAFAAMKDFFLGFTPKKEEPKPQEQPVAPPQPANDNMAAFAQQFGKFAAGLEKMSGSIDAVATRLSAVEQAHADLKTELASTDANPQRRTLSTGGEGRIKTDC